MRRLRKRHLLPNERPVLCEVLWEDHASTSGWARNPEQEGALLVRSVGYLTRLDKNYINLTQSHSPTNTRWAETLTLVRRAVRSIRVLGRSRMAIRVGD